MSTGEKLAIGAGAVALLGCYEFGCFSRKHPADQAVTQPTSQLPQANAARAQTSTVPSAPVGATCNDGTRWTGSQRSGACSRQQGVKAFDAVGGNGQVWVNTKSRVYHCPGDPEFGKTRSGAYMTEAAAKANGDRPSGGRTCFQAK